MDEERETFRFMLPRTMDWEEPLEGRRIEIDNGDVRRDGMPGVSVTESLRI